MNYNKMTIEDVNVQGKRVLVRVDFNVPLDANKKITDENRIVGALPTIKYLVKNGAKVVLCSHLGRPKGQFNDKYSLAPVAVRLSQLLGQEVKMCKDVVGEDADRVTAALQEGEVCLLENLRFHKEEEANDPEFAKKQPTIPSSPRSWPPTPTCSSTTRSAPRTAPTPPPRASPTTCPAWPAT